MLNIVSATWSRIAKFKFQCKTHEYEFFELY